MYRNKEINNAHIGHNLLRRPSSSGQSRRERSRSLNLLHGARLCLFLRLPLLPFNIYSVFDKDDDIDIRYWTPPSSSDLI